LNLSFCSTFAAFRIIPELDAVLYTLRWIFCSIFKLKPLNYLHCICRSLEFESAFCILFAAFWSLNLSFAEEL
jgi:hypothetical protein